MPCTTICRNNNTTSAEKSIAPVLGIFLRTALNTGSVNLPTKYETCATIPPLVAGNHERTTRTMIIIIKIDTALHSSPEIELGIVWSLNRTSRVLLAQVVASS